MTTLCQSSFIPHNYHNPRVIVEGCARLSGEYKTAQFFGLVGTLLTNGKMVDPIFVLNSTIIRGGRKDLRNVKDVPLNMMAMWSYVKILEKSMQTFQPKSGRTRGGKKGVGGNYSQYADQVYFTMSLTLESPITGRDLFGAAVALGVAASSSNTCAGVSNDEDDNLTISDLGKRAQAG
jgi:hypothetical protein